MKKSICFAFIIGFILCCSHAFAGNTPQTDEPSKHSIFQSFQKEEIVDITIETDLAAIKENKKKVVYQAATITINKGESSVSHALKISARGRSRRKYCEFPPLKLKFSKAGLASLGLQEKYKSIKLVTHCNEDGDNNVLKEYLAYQMYQELTDKSLKTQLVRVNYMDAKTGNSFTKYGILIENTKEMVSRLGGVEEERMGLTADVYNREQLNLFAVFQYMIGNEDWRLEFLRNVKLVAAENGEIIPVPYDFDASGLVNASYAVPDRDLRLSTVVQRQFMGQFKTESERTAVISKILSKKENLINIVKGMDQLSRSKKRESLQYLKSFFDIIENNEDLNQLMPTNGEVSIPTGVDGSI